MGIEQISQKLLVQPTSEFFAFFTDNTLFEHVALTALNTIWLEYEDQLIQELSENGIEGDYAEFGIWKGDRLNGIATIPLQEMRNGVFLVSIVFKVYQNQR